MIARSPLTCGDPVSSLSDVKVFISYRRSDDPSGAGRLFDHLESRFGKGNVFMDVDSNMPLGIDFRDHITTRIEAADAVLAIIGPNWLRSIRERADDPKDFVRLEIEAALKCCKPLVPVLMGASVPDEAELPPSIAKLAYLNGMPIDVGADFRHHAQKLCGKLEAGVGTGTEATAPTTAASPSPPKRQKNVPKSGQKRKRAESIGWKDVVVQIGLAIAGGSICIIPILADGRGLDNGPLGDPASLAIVAGTPAGVLLSLYNGYSPALTAVGFAVVGVIIGTFVACRLRRLGLANSFGAIIGAFTLGAVGIAVAAWWMNRRKSKRR